MKRSTLLLKKGKAQINHIIFGFAIVLLFLSTKTNAQTLEVGPFIGGAYYLGDLNPQKHFIESNLAFGGILKYNLNQRWALSLSANQTTLKSDASNYNADHTAVPASNLSTSLSELSLQGELNFFRYAVGDRKEFWTPYLFAGGSVFLANSVNSMAFSTPFGIGVKYSPFKKLGLNLFWGARKTFTDDLDQVVSIDYQGYNGDWYIFYGLNITFAFHLGKDNSCRNLINGKYY